jgi:tRNA A37 methylthiotransferase MiaB
MDPFALCLSFKISLEILDVMRERENICNYLDMPLQHAANNMLKAMKRQITREEMEELDRCCERKGSRNMFTYNLDRRISRRNRR